MSGKGSATAQAWIAFNLLVIVVVVIALVSVVRDLASPKPDLSKDLVLLPVLLAILALGVGLLVRLVRSSRARR